VNVNGGRWNRVLILTLLMGTVYFSAEGCAPAESNPKRVLRPGREHEWTVGERGLQQWGCSNERIYGVSVEPEALLVWTWRGQFLEKDREFRMEPALGVTALAGNLCLLYPVKKGESDLFLKNFRTNHPVQRWPTGNGWYVFETRASGNGRYVGVALREDGASPPSGYEFGKPRVRIGLLDPSLTELNWIVMLRGSQAGQDSNIRCVVPSDDGQHVALAGWNNGLTMIDVAGRKERWNLKPDDEAAITYAAFTPDGTTVYAGGTMGWVYGIEAKSGKAMSRWCATDNGEPQYGHRISAIGVSPDGRWVAAGTGPEGEVYLWSRASGRLLCVFVHGDAAVLITTFSPDSKALATLSAGSIKVWDIPDKAD